MSLQCYCIYDTNSRFDFIIEPTLHRLCSLVERMVLFMATESITHAFYFKGRAARRFADAVERSMNAPPMDLNVNATELHGEELKEFIRKTWEEHEKRKI